MLTIDILKEYGANVEEGLGRCLNNEAFYLRMVGMGLDAKNFDALKNAVDQGDAKAAFEAAHALKGLVGNLSLTPLYTPICEITEKLRGQDELPDVGSLLDEIMAQYQKFAALI